MKSKYFGILILILIISSCTSSAKKNEWAKEAPETKYSEARENEVWGEILKNRNPALYYGTPLYDLAETLSGAIWFRDKEEIAQLINAIPKEYINYQEKKFGMTIGQFALRTNNMFAIRKLLDRGLNPNIMDNMGNAIIIDINNYTYGSLPESFETLKYMIKKGANVNLYSEKAQSSTPLIEASLMGRLKNVKTLVEAGANPDFIDELGYAFKTPLSAALSFKQIEVVNYLIFDQKVDFRALKYPRTSKFHPGEYEILYDLREMFFELNSKRYLEKMKLVAYLKTQGLDYWSTPIDERFIGSRPKEYMDKY